MAKTNIVPLLWSGLQFFGSGRLQGLTSAFAWTSDPFDAKHSRGATLEVTAPSGGSPGMLVVPSTTAGLGLLYAANAQGTSPAIQIKHNTPSGTTSTVAVVADVITVSPSTTATNASIAALINSNANAAPLVTAYPWGWQGVNPLVRYGAMDEFPMDSALNDVVIAFAQTALSGDAASSAQVGTLQVQGSNDLANWSTLDSSYQLAVSGPATYTLAMPNTFHRYYRASWLPSGSPTGPLFGSWFGKRGG